MLFTHFLSTFRPSEVTSNTTYIQRNTEDNCQNDTENNLVQEINPRIQTSYSFAERLKENFNDIKGYTSNLASLISNKISLYRDKLSSQQNQESKSKSEISKQSDNEIYTKKLEPNTERTDFINPTTKYDDFLEITEDEYLLYMKLKDSK